MTADIDKAALALRVAEKLDRMGVEAVVRPQALVRTNDEARVLASILREYAGGGWRPIETAPKDGTKVQLWLRAPYSRCVTAQWFEPWGNWQDGGFPSDLDEFSGIGSSVPTHWRPLPAPPAEAAK